MKTFKSFNMLLRAMFESGPLETHSCHQDARRIVAFLLEERPLVFLTEASVHQSKRSKIWVASFTAANGTQIWRSTGLTAYDQALMLANHWQAQERRRAASLGRTQQRPRIGIHYAGPGGAALSQKEVAQLMGLSERGVRAIEKRALRKLRNHPLLKQLWRHHVSDEPIEEDGGRLTPDEIEALFDLAQTHEEICLLSKVLRMVQL